MLVLLFCFVFSGGNYGGKEVVFGLVLCVTRRGHNWTRTGKEKKIPDHILSFRLTVTEVEHDGREVGVSFVTTPVKEGLN